VEVVGNKDSMNLPQMLHKNILGTPYFKNTLYEKKTYHAVVDEIFYHVSQGSPYSSPGNVSSFFCILFKLYTMKLTENQISGRDCSQRSAKSCRLAFYQSGWISVHQVCHQSQKLYEVVRGVPP
jgi:PRP38 family